MGILYQPPPHLRGIAPSASASGAGVDTGNPHLDRAVQRWRDYVEVHGVPRTVDAVIKVPRGVDVTKWLEADQAAIDQLANDDPHKDLCKRCATHNAASVYYNKHDLWLAGDDFKCR